MTYFITGITGTLGTALTTTLLADPSTTRVIGLSRGEHRQAEFAKQFSDPRLECWIGDVRDRDRLQWAFDCRPDVVIHAAALKRVESCEGNTDEARKTNIDGTHNVCELAMRADVPKVIVVSSDKACVDGRALVAMADGRVRPLRSLVRSRVASTVKSLTRAGLHDKPIIGWHETPRSGREMIGVTYEYGPYHGRCRSAAWVTEDHPVLAVRGWLRAGELTPDDLLITAEPAPNEKQMGLLVGCLLGDAHANVGGCGLRFGQSADGLPWLEAIRQGLVGLGPLSIRAQASKRNSRQTFHAFTLSSSGYTKKLREGFYAPTKIVPRELVVAHWSAEMLAAWYCDDGCLADGRYVRLATHNFSADDVDWLATEFTTRGLPAYRYELTVGGKKYHELRLTSTASSRFIEIVGRYVPVRRKLPEWAKAFDASAWNLGEPNRFLSRPILLRSLERKRDKSTYVLPQINKNKTTCYRGHALSGSNVQLTSAGGRQCMQCARERKLNRTTPRNVFCLDVADSHNFIVGGVVLHNCSPETAYGATKAAAEALAIGQNAWRGHRPTRISVVRYGNILGSAGSFLPTVLRARDTGQSIPITDLRASRFWWAVEDAAQFIVTVADRMAGAEIWIPKLVSSRVVDLVKAIAPENALDVVGMRGSEKLHESMINATEAAYTHELPDCYVLLPKLGQWWSAGIPGGAVKVAEGFTYSSDQFPLSVSMEATA